MQRKSNDLQAELNATQSVAQQLSQENSQLRNDIMQVQNQLFQSQQSAEMYARELREAEYLMKQTISQNQFLSSQLDLFQKGLMNPKNELLILQTKLNSANEQLVSSQQHLIQQKSIIDQKDRELSSVMQRLRSQDVENEGLTQQISVLNQNLELVLAQKDSLKVVNESLQNQLFDQGQLQIQLQKT